MLKNVLNNINLISRVVGASIAIMLLSACGVPRGGLSGLEGLDVSPTVICPGEVVKVSWEFGTQYRDCERGGYDCKTLSVSADPPPSTSSDGMINDNIYDLSGDTEVTLFEDTVFSFDGRFREGRWPDSRSVDVIDPVGEYPVTFEGVCNGTVPQHAGVEFSPRDYSECLSLDEICNPNGYVVTVWSAHGPTRLGPGDCLGPASPKVSGEDFSIVPEGFDYTSYYCGPEAENPPDDIGLIFVFGCSSDSEACPDVEAEQDDLPDGFPTQSLITPIPPESPLTPDNGGGQPPPDSPTPQPDQPGGDICANHGGIQWQGQTCVCAGFTDNVTICNDGTKYDDVTDQQCTPDPAQCPQDDGGNQDGGGGQTCGQQSCGNGTCQPNCGETPNSCPADCP